MAAALNVYKMQNSTLDVVISIYEPYLSFSSVLIRLLLINVAREHH